MFTDGHEICSIARDVICFFGGYLHEVVEWGEGDERGETEEGHDLQGGAPAGVRVEGAVDREHRRVALEEPLVLGGMGLV